MSLPCTAYTDRSAYLNGGYWASVGQYPAVDAANNIGARYCYYDRLECIIQKEVGAVDNTVRVDAHYLDNSSAVCKRSTPNTLDDFNRYVVGEWDKTSNTQKLYGAKWTNELWYEIDVDNMTEVGTIYSSTVKMDSCANGSSWPDAGHWRTLLTESTHMVFFETLDYALVACVRAVIPGGGVDNDSYRPVLVRLSTGEAFENVPIFTRYASSPNDEAEHGPFIGNTFSLGRIQFVPDDDSTPSQPKGYMLFHQAYHASNTPTWVQQVDWNPSGAGSAEGIPTRVHCHQRLLSRYHPNQAAWPSGMPDVERDPLICRAADDQWLVIWGDGAAGPQDPGDCGTVLVSKTPTLSDVTRPTALAKPKTNSTAIFVSTVLGDLGERIAGASCELSLKRTSEIREVMATTGTPDEAVAVDHPPIDHAAGVTIWRDDVELVEETDWSLTTGAGDPDTGVVQFISPHTTSGVYEIAYRHVTAPTAGSHGNLLTPSARSDDDGNLYARVRYDDDDDLIGQWDYLEAVVE